MLGDIEVEEIKLTGSQVAINLGWGKRSKWGVLCNEISLSCESSLDFGNFSRKGSRGKGACPVRLNIDPPEPDGQSAPLRTEEIHMHA